MEVFIWEPPKPTFSNFRNLMETLHIHPALVAVAFCGKLVPLAGLLCRFLPLAGGVFCRLNDRANLLHYPAHGAGEIRVAGQEGGLSPLPVVATLIDRGLVSCPVGGEGLLRGAIIVLVLVHGRKVAGFDGVASDIFSFFF